MNNNDADIRNAELDRELQAFLQDLDPGINKHDRVIVGIHTCIEIGITTGPEIIAALQRQGFHAQHVGIMLHDLAGSDPKRHRWVRLPSGHYRSHD